jgi:hypothetical protein
MSKERKVERKQGWKEERRIAEKCKKENEMM